MTVEVREEGVIDADQIRAVNQLAFGQPEEARLVDRLRGLEQCISLVATIDGAVVGHILFTPVEIVGASRPVRAAGLGPMAVRPEYQRQGVGSRLVRAGLEACRDRGFELVVLVGHPSYYPRFGFAPADTRGLRWEHDAPREAFMVTELQPGAGEGAGGTVRFRPEFDEV